MPTTESAAVAALVIAALHAGHWIGDHLVQTEAQVQHKGTPSDSALALGAPPWQGWSWCVRHVMGYTACQSIALALATIVAPLTAPGVCAAVALSATTHAVIDRRWLVQKIVRLKKATGWDDGPYLVDQSLHHAAILLSGITATVVATATGAALVLAVGLTLVGMGLIIEQHRAARLRRTAAAEEYPVPVLVGSGDRAA